MTFLQTSWWTNGPSRDKKKTERFECSTGGGAFHGGAHVATFEVLRRQAELGDDLHLELFAGGQEALALKSGDRRTAMPAVARGWGRRRPTPPSGAGRVIGDFACNLQVIRCPGRTTVAEGFQFVWRA